MTTTTIRVPTLSTAGDVWPMDFVNGRRWAFNPRGFLVTVVDSADEANAVTMKLREGGFEMNDLRTYSAEQVSQNECRWNTRGLAARATARLGGGRDDLETQFSNARKGRVAVWI